MIQISLQRQESGLWAPYSQEDHDKGQAYKINMVCRAKITGYQDQRSLAQLKLYWACCNLTAQNNDDPAWATREDVSFQVKLALQHFNHEKISVVGAKVFFEVGSISYENMGHLEACNFMTRAYDVMAAKVGVTADVLVEEAKQRCGARP